MPRSTRFVNGGLQGLIVPLSKLHRKVDWASVEENSNLTLRFVDSGSGASVSSVSGGVESSVYSIAAEQPDSLPARSEALARRLVV